MRLRYERKQVMLKKASNYAMLSLLSSFSALALTLLIGVAINIIYDNTDLVMDICTLTFLGFGMLGILCMMLAFIYTEKAYQND